MSNAAEHQLPGEILTHVPQMSLRDYFAIHASDEDIQDMQACKPSGMINRQEARYMVADAMLREREGK